MFQHTAARRRLLFPREFWDQVNLVSTHSRTEAAAEWLEENHATYEVSTHSRTEAAA